MFAVTVPLVHTGRDRIGWMSHEDWSATIANLAPANPALATLDVEAVFDLSLLREAYGESPR